MSMFDWYQPKEKAASPECGATLTEWQGKDGPCYLYIWVEGVAYPTDQRASDDWKFPPELRLQDSLPPNFIIYSYDCERHNPIWAECQTIDEVWAVTRILPFRGAP